MIQDSFTITDDHESVRPPIRASDVLVAARNHATDTGLLPFPPREVSVEDRDLHRAVSIVVLPAGFTCSSLDGFFHILVRLMAEYGTDGA